MNPSRAGVLFIQQEESEEVTPGVSEGGSLCATV